MIVRSVAGCLEEMEVSQEWLRAEADNYALIAEDQERKGEAVSAEYWRKQEERARAEIPQARTAAQLGGPHRKIRKSPGQKSR